MGTKTTSIPSPGSFGNQTVSAASFRGSGSIAMPEDAWIDKLHFYAGGNGGTHNFTFVVYRTSDGALVAQTGAGGFSGKAWKTLTFALNSGNNNSGYNSTNLWLPAGYNFLVGAYCDGAADIGINAGSGSWAWHSGTGVQSSYVGWSVNPFGNAGDMYWYVEYFPPCQVTSITATPVAPGATFDVYGLSFSSGVSDVQVGGVSCPSFTVLNDTHLTAICPSGIPGQVQVLSNAGAMTSVATLGVAQIWVDDGAGYEGSTIWVDDGTTWQQATAVWVDDGTNWQQVG
jgi:hypothetical protein